MLYHMGQYKLYSGVVMDIKQSENSTENNSAINGFAYLAAATDSVKQYRTTCQ